MKKVSGGVTWIGTNGKERCIRRSLAAEGENK